MDAEYISKILGVRTIRVSAGSVSYQLNNNSDTRSYNYQAIPLIRPDKVSTDISLIMRTGHSPVKAHQYIWFKEQNMKFLQEEPAFIPQKKIKTHDFNHEHKKLSSQTSEIFLDYQEFI